MEVCATTAHLGWVNRQVMVGCATLRPKKTRCPLRKPSFQYEESFIMTIGTLLRVLLRLLSWNVLSLFGLCLILLAISSGQGQELLRLAHDHPGGVIRTLNTLLLPLLLFSTTCFFF